LHGGVTPTFWDWAVLPARTTLAWAEYWYPVNSIGVFAAATTEAALAVRQDGDYFRIGVHSTAARANGESALYVWDRTTCTQLAQWDFSIDPAHPFVTSMPWGGRTLDEISVALLDSREQSLVAFHPANCYIPEAHVEPLPAWVTATTFTIMWIKPGEWSGIGSFQVQVRDGYEGTWMNWLTETQTISATFEGLHGHTYSFRARTLSANPRPWSDEEWGQAFTTVLTEPAPVLVTSSKLVSRPGAAPAHQVLFLDGEMISYTLLLSNTGNLDAIAVVTDVVPQGMVVLTETLTATCGSPPVYALGSILWSDVVTAGETARLSYVFSPTAAIQRGERITNTAEIAGSVLGKFTRKAEVVRAWPVWLPVVMR